MINKKLQRAFGIGALVFTLGIVSVGCERKIAETKTEAKNLKIGISEYGCVPQEWNKKGANLGGDITYNGMSNKETFSLSHGGSAAVNIYYPADSKEIRYKGTRLKVLEVTPEHIVLDYLGKSTENK